MKIKIFTDTSADLYKEDAEKYGIGMLSFRSVFGEEVYKTGVDITNEEFFNKLDETGIIPKTSQTPPGEMYEILKAAADEYDAVIYFCISSKGSGQYGTACMIRNDIMEENPDARLYIVDSRAYSLFIGRTAIYAAQLAAEGLDAEEIIERSKAFLRRWRCMLLVGDLKYLEKGGRIRKTTAVIGTMLDIKPILGVVDGMIEAQDKLRGSKKLIQKLIAKLDENGDIDTDNPEFMVVHSDEEKGAELCEKLREKYGADTVSMCHLFGPIVGTHVGKGAFAVIYKTNTDVLQLD